MPHHSTSLQDGPPTKPALSNRATRSRKLTSSSASTLKIPIKCPESECDLHYFHQHPPNLQYFKACCPARSVSGIEEWDYESETDGEDGEGERRCTDANDENQNLEKMDRGLASLAEEKDIDAVGEDDIEWWNEDRSSQVPDYIVTEDRLFIGPILPRHLSEERSCLPLQFETSPPDSTLDEIGQVGGPPSAPQDSSCSVNEMDVDRIFTASQLDRGMNGVEAFGFGGEMAVAEDLPSRFLFSRL